MIIQANRKFPDQQGIEILREAKPFKDPFSYATKNNAQKILDIASDMEKHINNAFSQHNLPFGIILNKKDLDIHDICGDPGRRSWLEAASEPIIMTPVIADNTVILWSKILNAKLNKKIFNYEKDTQAGKTHDYQVFLILACTGMYLYTGTYHKGLVLMTAKKSLKHQAQVEWEQVEGFFKLFDIRYNGKLLKIKHYLDTWSYSKDIIWTRRSHAKQTYQDFESRVQKAYKDRHHLYIITDEAHEGQGKDSVLDRLLQSEYKPNKDCYAASADHKSHLTIIHGSANLEAQKGLGPCVENIRGKNDVGYIHWQDRPCASLSDFGKMYNVPEFDKCGESISYKYSAYGEIKEFTKIWFCYDQSNNTYVPRKNGEKASKNWTTQDLDYLAKNLEIKSEWENYKNKFVPRTIAKMARNVFLMGNLYQKKSKKFNFITLRYLNQNQEIIDLIPKIEKHANGKFLTMFYGHGIPNGHKRDYASCGSLKKAIEQRYEDAGMPYGKLPMLIFWTGEGRCGTQVSGNYVQIEFTDDPSTIVTINQTLGRAGGHKQNVLIVLTEQAKKEVNKVKKGTSRKPISAYVTSVAGAPRKTIEIRLEEVVRSLVLQKYKDYIENEILNKDWMVETCKVANNNAHRCPKGGWSAVTGHGMPDFWQNPLVLAAIRECEINHPNIFVDQDNKPIYKKMLIQRPGTTNELGEEYDIASIQARSIVKNLNLRPLYSPVGLRFGDKNTNPGARPYREGEEKRRQQVQIHYGWNAKSQRMFYIKTAFRLQETPIMQIQYMAKEGTVPHNIMVAAERSTK